MSGDPLISALEVRGTTAGEGWTDSCVVDPPQPLSTVGTWYNEHVFKPTTCRAVIWPLLLAKGKAVCEYCGDAGCAPRLTSFRAWGLGSSGDQGAVAGTIVCCASQACMNRGERDRLTEQKKFADLIKDCDLTTPHDPRADPSRVCVSCGRAEPCFPKLQMCSKCKCAYFCDKRCMAAGWKAHKKTCVPPISKEGVEEVKKGEAHRVYESPTSRVLGFLSSFLVLVSSVFSLVMDLFSGQFSAFVIGFLGRAPGDAATAEHLRACADRLLPLPEGVAVYTLEISGVWIDETGVMTSAGSCVFSGPLKPSKKLYKKYAESHPSLRQRVDSGEARVELVVTTKVENAQLRKTDLRHLVMGLHEAVEKA
jgi:hypothetical protein